MRRLYADLHLCPNLNDPKHVSALISKASELGYRLIAIPLPPNCTDQEIKRIQELCSEAKMDFASRVNLKPRTPNELLSNLRRIRRKFEIVSVLCDSKNVSRQAAKDRRVDLLNFPLTDFHNRFFDMAEAELASNSVAVLEIDMKPLLTLEGPMRTRLLSALRKEAGIAEGFHLPIVLSSGASNEMLLRKPAEVAAMSSLFDLSKESALGAVSKNPIAIVKRNREKLSPRFVAPGIRVVRRGKDC
jgi:RNase P/RNase MRP subunit p30